MRVSEISENDGFGGLVEVDDTRDFLDSVVSDPDELKRRLYEKKFILIRGLKLDRRSFGNLGRSISESSIEYKGGIGPRHLVDDEVYTSTDLPPPAALAQHHEMAYTTTWPMLVLFHSEVCAPFGGATTVCDSSALLETLDEAWLEKLRNVGVRYVRNYFDGNPYKSISETFGTDDKDKINQFCAANDIEAIWLSDTHLQLVQTAPAVRAHPVTGQESFFNTLGLWHPQYWQPLTQASYPGIEEPKDRDHLWQTSEFGNGDPFEDDDIKSLLKLYEGSQFEVQWKQGDVLIIDNMLASHGRMAFQGDRSVTAQFRGCVTPNTLSNYH